ncbi:MAG: chlorhexidine efflux transporter [Rubrivivax sp.]
MSAIAGSLGASGAVRGLRERVIQTLCFELVGLALVSLPFAHLSGCTVGDSLLVLLALSIVVMSWSAVHNTAFDLVERRWTGRLASNRPQRWRVLHALGLEVSALFATWPLVVALTALDGRDAFVAEIGLTLAYAAYGYCFHLVFDHIRPVLTPMHRGGATRLAGQRHSGRLA